MRMWHLALTLLALPLLVLLVVVLVPRDHASDDASWTSRLVSASLPLAQRPFMADPPKPAFTRRIAATATIDDVTTQLDKCRGPVAVDFDWQSTVLVAEHDYCGGTAWIGKIKMGQAVKLTGPGLQPGIYVADEMSHPLRGKATVADLPDADVVLQTCVSKTRLVLVGMTRVAPA